MQLPIQDKVSIPAHNKAVNSLSFPPKANKFATASTDFTLKLWDFQGLTRELKSYQQIIPIENHIVHTCRWNSTGSQLLVVAGGYTVQIYDHEGSFIAETLIGDSYIRDVTKCKGHTADAVDTIWSPLDKNSFYSCAHDGTIRMFSLETQRMGFDNQIPCTYTYRIVDRRGMCSKSCFATSLCATDTHLYSGCSDGSIQVFDLRRPKTARASQIFRSDESHKERICCLLVVNDTLISRDVDGIIMLWDVHNLKKGHLRRISVPSDGRENMNMCLSPSKKSLLVPVSSPEGNRIELWNLEVNCMSPDTTISLLNSPVCVSWPEEINQVAVAYSNGTVDIYYDKNMSQKGVLLTALSVSAREEDSRNIAESKVYTQDDWEALGYQESRDGSGMLRVKKSVRQKQSSRNLEAPAPFGSKWGAGGALSTHKSITADLAIGGQRQAGEDSQEVLQQVAQRIAQSQTEGVLVSGMPKESTAYEFREDDEEQAIRKLALGQKCPRCGLKMCECGYKAHDTVTKRSRLDTT